ncbi:kinase-like domain-containing protein [Aspergillus similis]
MRRFERIYDVVEPAEDYRRGGYHPVHLHDIYNQRYSVIGRLTFGQFSTVWLADDQSLQQHVALKILKSDASKDSKELAVFLHLSAVKPDHPGKRHVLELLDYFTHDGPNGTHLCLVLPVMVSDGKGMTITGKPHQVAYIQSISKQLYRFSSYSRHYLQPANIMFSTVKASHSDILLEPPEISPVRWLEGSTADDSAPKYLIAMQRRRGQLDGADVSELLVKVGNLGGVMQGEEFSNKPVTPTALRAPELIHQNAWNAGIDVWALGCLVCSPGPLNTITPCDSRKVFELATNEPLFPLGTFGLSAEQINEEHLGLISQMLNENGQMDEAFVKHLKDRLPPNFGARNIHCLASFLWSMLQQDPQKRMSTAELLSHLFFCWRSLELKNTTGLTLFDLQPEIQSFSIPIGSITANARG